MKDYTSGVDKTFDTFGRSRVRVGLPDLHIALFGFVTN